MKIFKKTDIRMMNHYFLTGTKKGFVAIMRAKNPKLMIRLISAMKQVGIRVYGQAEKCNCGIKLSFVSSTQKKMRLAIRVFKGMSLDDAKQY